MNLIGLHTSCVTFFCYQDQHQSREDSKLAQEAFSFWLMHAMIRWRVHTTILVATVPRLPDRFFVKIGISSLLGTAGMSTTQSKDKQSNGLFNLESADDFLERFLGQMHGVTSFLKVQDRL
jgi:hypothetical protein